jgi:hypothetical protein
MMNDDNAAGHAAFSSLISVADCDVQAFVYAHAAAGHSCAVQGKTATDRNASALTVIPLLIAVLTIIAAMFIAVVPHAATMATG